MRIVAIDVASLVVISQRADQMDLCSSSFLCVRICKTRRARCTPEGLCINQMCAGLACSCMQVRILRPFAALPLPWAVVVVERSWPHGPVTYSLMKLGADRQCHCYCCVPFDRRAVLGVRLRQESLGRRYMADTWPIHGRYVCIYVLYFDRGGKAPHFQFHPSRRSTAACDCAVPSLAERDLERR